MLALAATGCCDGRGALLTGVAHGRWWPLGGACCWGCRAGNGYKALDGVKLPFLGGDASGTGYRWRLCLLGALLERTAFEWDEWDGD